MDPRPKQTVGAEESLPVPASIPKVDQPKATINVAPTPPQKEGSDPGSLANDPATHGSSSSQPNTVQPNGDPRPDNDPQQYNDPSPDSDAKDNDSQQGSDNDGDSGPEAHSEPLAYPAVTPIVTNIAGQAITAAPNAIEIAGHTLSPGDPGATIDGTAISLDAAGQLIVGSKTIPLARKPPPQTIITSVAGQAITAAPNAVIVAGTSLSPKAPDITLDGMLISLNAASELVIGSKTIPLASASPKTPTLTTTIGGLAITAASDRVVIDGMTLTPGAPGTSLDGTLVSLDPANRLILGSTTIPLLLLLHHNQQSSTAFRAQTTVPFHDNDDDNGSKQTVPTGLGGLIVAALGSEGPFGAAAVSSSSSFVVATMQGDDSSRGGNINSTNTSGVQVFEGGAAVGRFLGNQAVAKAAVAVAFCFCSYLVFSSVA